MMKTWISVLLIASSVQIAWADTIPASISKWLKPLSVSQASLNGGVLTVQMNRPAVTDEIYSFVIVNAVCMSLIDKPGSWAKANIQRVEVINSDGRQGKVFNGGAKQCTAMASIPPEKIKSEWLPPLTTMKR